MGAVAAATERIAVGSLVARATLRPHATLANGFDTLARDPRPRAPRSSPIGAGDAREPGGERDLRARASAPSPSASPRCATRSTRRATAATRCGSAGPTPRCARSPPRTPTAGTGGAAGLERFREQAANLRRPRPARRSRCRGVGSWCSPTTTRPRRPRPSGSGAGDHVLVGGPELVAAALRAYADAGAEWLMIGPIDSSDPDNARILGEEILPRLR